MSRFLTHFRVGLVVIFGAAAFLVLLSFISKQHFGDKETFRYEALFADASGLGTKSRIQIAGIEIGVVDKITLTEDAKALVTLRIKKDIILHEDARVTKRSASLLGDFLLEIYPGTTASPPLH